MLSDDRDVYRKIFFICWEKYKKQMPLDTEETRLLMVMLEHPEYHAIFKDPETHLHQEYSFEENPFLHLSLHLALREQIRTDRPLGIKKLYDDLLMRYEQALQVEHLMLPCLIRMLTHGQQTGTMPDDALYLSSLKELLF